MSAVRNAQAEKVNTEVVAVICNNCGAMRPLALTEADAIVRWNGRPL